MTYKIPFRGVPRLDGAQGKKQVWHHWEQMYSIEGSTCDIVRTFRRPVVIRPPGFCALLHPLGTSMRPLQTVHHLCSETKRKAQRTRR